MKQKEIFLQSEGDAWFIRNQYAVATRKLPDDDPLLSEIIDISKGVSGANLIVLEIGCGDGTRLAWLKHNLNAECYGLEPSAQAVSIACAQGLNVQQGTADLLPFAKQSFDIVIFGFCLYLCDREDLFHIASEADRVLRGSGWIMIQDFFHPEPYANAYLHRVDVQSYKMDYRTSFTWHPNYQCVTHKVRHHSDGAYTDKQDEWVAVSTLRKHCQERSA